MVAPGSMGGDCFPRPAATAAYKGGPTAGASAVTAHNSTHTPPPLALALPKDLQVVRRQKGSEESKTAASGSTSNNIISVPCFSLVPTGRENWETRGSLRMGDVLSERSFQG